MKNRGSSATNFVLLAGFIFLLIAVAAWPEIDLAVSGLFYMPDKASGPRFGFTLAYNPLFDFLHNVATRGAWAFAVLLLAAAIAAFLRRRPLLGIASKGWMFLFLGLLLAPGLVANVALKDHWGRARPHQVTEFGGTMNFSPALEPQEVRNENGSFVAGDAAFGFYLSAFGYVVSRRRSGKFFWGGLGIGALLGAMRIAMGAHFLSDVLFAGFSMLLTLAGLHAAMFGRRATRQCWRGWMMEDGSVIETAAAPPE